MGIFNIKQPTDQEIKNKCDEFIKDFSSGKFMIIEDYVCILSLNYLDSKGWDLIAANEYNYGIAYYFKKRDD